MVCERILSPKFTKRNPVDQELTPILKPDSEQSVSIRSDFFSTKEK